jgi:hypothetical protein
MWRLRCCIRLLWGTHELLQAPLELAAREQHLAIAAQTAQANIGANAHNAPLIAAARVRFAQGGYIIQVHVNRSHRLWLLLHLCAGLLLALLLAALF